MWIKICGMTTPEAIAAALAARVDAIGFVFADSPRQLTLADAAALAAPARGRIRCVAVTRHPSQRHLDDILEVFRPDVLQTDAEDLAVLQLAAAARAAARVPRVGPLAGTPRIQPGPLPTRLLFEGPASGSGIPCDWTAAQRAGPQSSTRAGRRPRCRQRRDGHRGGSPLRSRCLERSGGAARRQESGRGGEVRRRRPRCLRADPTGATDGHERELRRTIPSRT